MTEDRLEAIRARHVQEVSRHAIDRGAVLCRADLRHWPCDTVQVIEVMDGALAAVSAERDAAREVVGAAESWHDARTRVTDDAEADWRLFSERADDLASAVDAYRAAHRSLR